MKKIFLLFALIIFVIATSVITVSACPTITFSQTNVDCNGNCNGEIVSTVSGGAPGYTYSWSNGATTSTISNLCTGTYTLCVTDANGCTICETTVITEPASIVITGTVTNVSCNGACDGEIATLVSGGTAPYSYLWSNGANTPNATGLCAGTYNVCVTDANGCTTCESYVITEPTALSLVTSSTTSSCGNADGSASVSVSGGTPGYTYLWSPGGATTDTVNNIPAGSYSVLVTDANGCTNSAYVAVSDTGGPTVVIDFVSNVSCNGACDGSMVVTGSGGMQTHYLNLCAGTYTICSTGFNGCVTCETAIITEPSPIVITGNVTSTSCYGACDGTATASASGGIGSYTYSWNTVPVQTTLTATGLCAGTYTVCVTDSSGCSVCENFTVTSPSQITATAAITNTSCYGACDGSIQVTGVLGGAGGIYSFLWLPGGETTPYIQNACAGTYTLCITDTSGCVECINYTVSQPAPVIPIINTIGDSVYSSAAFAYQWYLNASPITGATNQGHDPIQPGYYWVTVTDANGCTGVSDSIFITPVSIVDIRENSENFNLFPVPSSDKAFLKFDVFTQQQISINLYDINGRLAEQVYTGIIEPGSQELIINTASLPMGVYVLKIKGKEITRNLRLVVSK